MTAREPRPPYVDRRLRVERLVRAEPQVVFDLLADPYRHHVIDGTNTLTGQVRGPGRLFSGATFTMGMKMGPIPYRTTNTVVDFEESSRIAWQTAARRRGRIVMGGQVWAYELEPRPEHSTLVRASYDWSGAMRPEWTIERLGMPERARAALVATLDRLADHLEGREQR